MRFPPWRVAAKESSFTLYRALINPSRAPKILACYFSFDAPDFSTPDKAKQSLEAWLAKLEQPCAKLLPGFSGFYEGMTGFMRTSGRLAIALWRLSEDEAQQAEIKEKLSAFFKQTFEMREESP